MDRKAKFVLNIHPACEYSYDQTEIANTISHRYYTRD